MRKRLVCVLIALCFLFSFSSCTATEKSSDVRLNVLCTLFPQYDWIRNITKGADGVEVSLIIANGTDPHSYQPTATDIMNISNCDMLVYVGGDSDTWVKKAIERSKNGNISAVMLTELDGIELHDISSSSHSHEGHSHGEHSHEGHSHEGHSTLDEHLYLSLENAIIAVNELTERLCEIDAENKELYIRNASDYIIKLFALNENFKIELEQIPEEDRFVLFADRFPFVYLLSDYDIHYAAAFEGCTNDVDADFDTVIRLIHEANEHNVNYIAVTESSDKALANTVISSTASKGQDIAVFNSMQAVTQTEINGGLTYLSIMEENINVIRTVLGLKQKTE